MITPMKYRSLSTVLSCVGVMALLCGCGQAEASSSTGTAESSTGSSSSSPASSNQLYWTSTDGYSNHYIDGYLGNETDIVIPSSVNGITIGILNSFVFAGHTNLKTIVIPASITSIQEGVFGDCTSLTSVTFLGNVTHIGGSAFKNCTSLKSLVLPNSVTTIGAGAFAGCTGLTSFTLPAGLSYLNNYAFQGCDSLTSFTINGSNSVFSTVDGVLFNKSQSTLVSFPNGKAGSYSIPKTVTRIQDGAFFGSHLLTSLVLPTGLVYIQNGAFQGCDSLSSISLDSSNKTYTVLDNVLFSFDQSILVAYLGGLVGAYSIPSSVTDIGMAFFDCTHLTQLNIPPNLTSFSATAFYDCPNLEAITVDASNTTWSSSSGSLLSKDGKTLCFVPNAISGSYSVSNGVTTIGVGAFHGCFKIKEIVLATSTSSFMAGAFYGCSALTHFECPALMYYIEAYSFYGCSSLTSLSLPTGLYGIRDYAFYGCKQLAAVTLGDNFSSLGKACFAHCSSLTSVNIPAKLLNISQFAFYDCVSLTSVTFSGYVNAFNYWCFAKCTSLVFLTVPEAVQSSSTSEQPAVTFNEGAFAYCTNLSSIVIPKTTTYVGARCFALDNKLSCYFAATSFESIKLTDSWNILAGTSYLYSETRPTASGNFWHYVSSIPTPW